MNIYQLGEKLEKKLEIRVQSMPRVLQFYFIFRLIPLQSIVSYARSVFLQSNKKIFDVNQLPLDAFAQ